MASPLSGGPIAETRQCKHCRHWRAPPQSEIRAWEAFKKGVSARRVKTPTGQCDQVLTQAGKPISSSATPPGFSCLSFAQSFHDDDVRHSGIVTVHMDGRLVWSGPEEDLPDEYR